MEIFDFAMQMEKDGEQYFRELAESCGDRGLANILTMLADTEITHYNILKEMKEKVSPDLPETQLLADAKNIFVQMKEENQKFNFSSSQADLYTKAKEIEKKAEAFYLEKAEEMEDPAQKELFKRLAAEERQHYLLFENIADFVSAPDQWLENSEWHHLDSF